MLPDKVAKNRVWEFFSVLASFKSNEYLRAVVTNYRESVDICKNSNFFFCHQKIPLGKLFSKTIFKSSSESPVWRKIESLKFEQTRPKGW